MESPVKRLNACVDTLVLNVFPTDRYYEITKRRLALELQEELEALKKLAQGEEDDIATRFTFLRHPLKMKAKGGDGFNWIMQNTLITLAVNRSAKMNLLAQVRLSSEFLQTTHDLGACISAVHLFLVTVFGQHFTLNVSSVDLALDVLCFDLGAAQDIKERFVTRAQLDDEMPLDPRAIDDGMIDGPDSIKRRWRRITGITFGARKANLSAIIYDKTHEIKYQSPNKTWMYDKWLLAHDEQGQPFWDGEAHVLRIEIRYKRPALGEMKQEGIFHGIESAWDLEERLPGLWAYAVGHAGGGADGLPDGWLRYVVPTDDTNRSRWPVHPDWQVIQTGFTPVLLGKSEYEQKQEQEAEYWQAVDESLTARPLAPALYTPPMKRHAKKKTTETTSPVALTPPEELVSLSVYLRPFVRERKRLVNLNRIVAQIAGCTITAEAWRPTGETWAPDGVEPDLSDTFQFLYNQVDHYLEEKGRDFTKLVYKKRVDYSLETVA
jgi:hypothetical protein